MKITLLFFSLLTFNLYAQTFPAPYCDIDDDGVTVEEISMVTFAEISILNSDTSSVLIDATDTEDGVFNMGDSYTITVAGNTAGNFDNDIVAFIDWNDNDILDDDGEIYEIGTLTNSNGDDGVTVSLDITIPEDAVVGDVRIRITKVYGDSDSPAIIDPCAISFDPFGQGVNPGFGQALDFTLMVGLIGVDDFDASALNLYPSPVKDILTIEYKSVLSDMSVYNLLGQEVYAHRESGNQLQVNLSSLQAGVYIVKVNAQEGVHSFRVIKE